MELKKIVKIHVVQIFDKSLQQKKTVLEDKVDIDEVEEEKIDKNKNINDLKVIPLSEVACHDQLDDCWMVIYDYVYDCTKFLKNHPGGQDILFEYAGRDASFGFLSTGHSKMATRLLENFLIGALPYSERLFRIPGGIDFSSGK